MRPGFPSLPRPAWVIATIIGALVAWASASLPMSFFALAAGDASASGSEPPLAIMLLGAGAMGAIAGLVLSFAQWRVLRRFSEGAWWWLPANAAAWAVGLPLVFAAVDLAQGAGSLAAGVAVMALGLLITGAVVGAMHGLALVELAAHQAGFTAGSTRIHVTQKPGILEPGLLSYDQGSPSTPSISDAGDSGPTR
jgi:hypothetical protein